MKTEIEKERNEKRRRGKKEEKNGDSKPIEASFTSVLWLGVVTWKSRGERKPHQAFLGDLACKINCRLVTEKEKERKFFCLWNYDSPREGSARNEIPVNLHRNCIPTVCSCNFPFVALTANWKCIVIAFNFIINKPPCDCIEWILRNVELRRHFPFYILSYHLREILSWQIYTFESFNGFQDNRTILASRIDRDKTKNGSSKYISA